MGSQQDATPGMPLADPLVFGDPRQRGAYLPQVPQVPTLQPFQPVQTPMSTVDLKNMGWLTPLSSGTPLFAAPFTPPPPVSTGGSTSPLIAGGGGGGNVYQGTGGPGGYKYPIFDDGTDPGDAGGGEE